MYASIQSSPATFAEQAESRTATGAREMANGRVHTVSGGVSAIGVLSAGFKS